MHRLNDSWKVFKLCRRQGKVSGGRFFKTNTKSTAAFDQTSSRNEGESFFTKDPFSFDSAVQVQFGSSASVDQ